MNAMHALATIPVTTHMEGQVDPMREYSIPAVLATYDTGSLQASASGFASGCDYGGNGGNGGWPKA